MNSSAEKQSLTNRKKELKREHAAMLSHVELLHGLAQISNARIRMFIDAIQCQRAKGTTAEDTMQAVRQAMCDAASLEPKARMLWDVNREVDMFVWGPMQLFFCVAWAFLQRYRYLKRRYPEVTLDDLERFIEGNRAGLDAAEELRNWILHPGHNRSPDDAMGKLFAVGGAPGNIYPQAMVNSLLALADRFTEMLGDEAS